MDFPTALDTIKAASLFRSFRTLSSPQGREAAIDGRRMLLFSSNSYLGLATELDLVRAATRALEQYGTSSGGSRLITGNMTLHLELEAGIAAFKGAEACLAFSSGYTANLGAISAVTDVMGRGAVIFSDELNHASIIDGCRLSRARTVVYRHNDMDDLTAKIGQSRPVSGLIVTDSVFSMDGDLARLPELAKLKKEFGLLLMIDEAHATGVLGRSGRGSLEYFGLETTDVDVLMGTLSKAIPSEGGFICGSRALCDYLRNTARSFIYTSALAPATVAVAGAGIDYLCRHPERVHRLQENSKYFAAGLTNLNLVADDLTPIFPVHIGAEAAAVQVSRRLLEQGVFVPCIRYPTVPKGRARLRFTLMATHTREDMDHALGALEKALLSSG